MKINPNSHSQTIWKTLVLRCHLRTLGYPPKSFGTATWLKNIAVKAPDYLLAFLGKGAWLKSVVLKERLTIPDHLLDHPVWIHLVVPTANWESNHSPLSVAYDHQATTPSVPLLGSRLPARFSTWQRIRVDTYCLSVSETQVLEFSLWRVSTVFEWTIQIPYLQHPSYWGRLRFAMDNSMACHRIVVVYHLRLFIDLEQGEVVGVNIERADI
jgi:hypothetical protein